MNDGSVEESERGVRARTKPAQCWLLLDACERAMTVLVLCWCSRALACWLPAAVSLDET